MTSRPVKTPGPDHPIEVGSAGARITVRVAGDVIADSREAVVLREGRYPPVYYLPRKDVDMARLSPTEHQTYCPYKGECSYFSIASGGERGTNAVWSYEAPYPAVVAIAGHLAFYPDRVDSIEVLPNG